MNNNQRRQSQMLGRVDDFGVAHADRFPESSLGRQTFAIVAEAVKQLNVHTVSNMSSGRGTPTKAMARATLLDRMAAISQTARVLAGTMPALEEMFVYPNMPNDQALLTTARVFAQDAEPLADRFIAHAMPKTCLADLKEAIGHFEEAIHEREAGKDDRTAARASIEAALSSGLAAVKTLDAIVANALRDDPITMAVWKRDRRVGYSNRTRSVDAAQPAPATATPAAPVAAPAASTRGVTS